MSSNFDYFLDLIFLLPALLLVRIFSESPTLFRWACIAVGLYLLYLFAPRFVLLTLAFWVAVWVLQYLAWMASRSGWAPVFLIVISIILLPMLLWKVSPVSFQDTVNIAGIRITYALAPFAVPADGTRETVIPLGLSFLTFRAIDLVVKVYLGLLAPLSLGRMLYYGLFPPILSIGPIAAYEEVRWEVSQGRPKPGDVAIGVFRIAFGVTKIFLLAVVCKTLADRLWDSSGCGAQIWIATWAYGLFFYFNFSGYSEVAIGSSRVLGIKLKENFNNPFLKTNPQAFWNAWHISLTQFAQRYVFVPLGGMRKNRQYFAIFVTIMVIALWHGLNIPILIFGFLHASVVVGHRFISNRSIKKQTEDKLAVRALKSFLLFTFVCFTIPLLLLDSFEVLAFYSSLIRFTPSVCGW
jgi:alginate O-acetyltransferase complex protein AlgI